MVGAASTSPVWGCGWASIDVPLHPSFTILHAWFVCSFAQCRTIFSLQGDHFTTPWGVCFDHLLFQGCFFLLFCFRYTRIIFSIVAIFLISQNILFQLAISPLISSNPLKSHHTILSRCWCRPAYSWSNCHCFRFCKVSNNILGT